MERKIMKKEYDFSNARPNPYAKETEKPDHHQPGCGDDQLFQEQAASSGTPYRTLISLYPGDWAGNKRQLKPVWN